MPESGCVWTAYDFVCDNRSLDCDKVIGDLVHHDKATVDASLISVIAVYGNKEEQPHRGNLWVSIITYPFGHLT